MLIFSQMRGRERDDELRDRERSEIKREIYRERGGEAASGREREREERQDDVLRYNQMRGEERGIYRGREK